MDNYKNISLLWEKFVDSKGWDSNPCHPLYVGKEKCQDAKLIKHIPGAPNFNYLEFRCKDKERTLVPEELYPNVAKLAQQLQVLRDYLNRGTKDPRGSKCSGKGKLNSCISITSGYRTKEYNSSSAVGGAKNSQHLYGKAADIKVEGMDPLDLYGIILSLIKAGKMHNGGLGLYNTFVHYDVRDDKARWDHSTGKKAKKAKIIAIGDSEGKEIDGEGAELNL